jgi:hypothetical protein
VLPGLSVTTIQPIDRDREVTFTFTVRWSGKMKFRLMQGKHAHGSKIDGSLVVYRQGDIIESDVDLEKKLKNKFQRVIDDAMPTVRKPMVKTEDEPQLPKEEGESDPGDTLEAMTVSQLKKFAAEEEIDLGTATKKSEIVNTIRAAFDVA